MAKNKAEKKALNALLSFLQSIESRGENKIEIKVVPNAPALEVKPLSPKKLLLYIPEKPEKGKASAFLISLFRRAGYNIEILRGKKSREKLVSLSKA